MIVRDIMRVEYENLFALLNIFERDKYAFHEIWTPYCNQALGYHQIPAPFVLGPNDSGTNLAVIVL